MEPFEPAPGMTVEDPQQIKAFADSLRVRLLVVLAEREATNQQLADQLGEPQAKVLYHLRFLLDVGLIVLVDTRVKGGNVEKYYRAVARTFDIRPSPELRAQIFAAEIDTIARDLTASTAIFPDGQRMLARSGQLSSERLEEFFSRLVELADEFMPNDGLEDEDDTAAPYVFASFIYRNPRNGGEAE